MINNNIDITIITLIKNDNKLFLRTLTSIVNQKYSITVEWIIIDGSDKENKVNINSLITKYSKKIKKGNILIRLINSKNKNIFGIYPCMNYGKNISRGKYIIFLNGGDTFYDDYSLYELFKNTTRSKKNNAIIFGQAKIIATDNIEWIFPGHRISNISRWLKFFEPNHQSMLFSKSLARKYNFSLKHNLIADGLWKRKLLNKAEEIIFVNKIICKFHLDGISSKKPSINLLIEIITNKNISFLRKIIFIGKFIFPKKIYVFYFLIQKFKSLFFEIIL